jgi:hypothetical protein
MNLNDYKESAARKICVYGQPKTGKTDLVGQLAEHKKLWWFDLDDGIKTLLHSPRMKKEWFNNIELFPLPDTQLLPVGIDTLLKVVTGGLRKICHKHGAVNCLRCTKDAPTAFSSIDVGTFTNNDVLVIDSGSQLASSIMCHISRKELAAGDDKWMNFSPGWDEYKKQGLVSNRIYSILQHAAFNFIVITHDQVVKMEDKSVKLVPIGGTSEYSKEFAKYFDEIIYCEIVNKAHKFASSTTYSGSVVLGSRTGKELEKMEKPSLKLFFD